MIKQECYSNPPHPPPNAQPQQLLMEVTHEHLEQILILVLFHKSDTSPHLQECLPWGIAARKTRPGHSFQLELLGKPL